MKYIADWSFLRGKQRHAFLQGPSGDEGPVGSQGTPGSTGSMGPTGPQGIQGQQGFTGANGTNGTNGSPGATGATGPSGGPGIRIDRYVGVSDGLGNYSVVFSTPFPFIPLISLSLLNPNTETYTRLTSVSTTGFTASVFQRTSLTVLSINLLSFSTTPVVGATIKAIVVEL